MYTVQLLCNRTHIRVLRSLLLKHFKLLEINISHTYGILLQELPGLNYSEIKNKQKTTRKETVVNGTSLLIALISNRMRFRVSDAKPETNVYLN
jgi:hypothetical protein